ncbi:MAG TPA: NeuD/PglB/VioB family sugar acetyltransferase [Conexibacter sp.]|nr:NeuD/PglB/VioB family sugar acetyltransferase [Conexibacter sp.]
MRTLVYGSRPDGHARVVVEQFGDCLDFHGLVDDFPQNAGRSVEALAVLGSGADLPRLAQEGVEAVVLGFGAARGRAEALAAIDAARLALPTLVHPTAHVAKSATIGPGSQLLARVVIGSGATLGRGVLVNSGAVVEHDVHLADAVVVDPGAVLTGRVAVGAGTEIGSGAVVLPDVRVGACATVGAGAVVTHDVPDGATVVGVPARPLQRC